VQHRADFKTSFIALLDATQKASDAHPSDGELIAYHEGELSTEERAPLRDHLVECRQCFELLRDLESFSAATRRAPEAPAKLEEAAFWRTLKPQLAASGPPPGLRPVRTWWQVPAAMAATFILTVMGFSGWIASRQVSQHQPRPNVVLYDLVENTSERTGRVNRPLEIMSDDESILILTPDSGLVHGGYQLRILDAEGKLVSVVEGLEKDSRDETFTLRLPPDFLPPGAYRVELYGRGGGGGGSEELIADYRIQVVTEELR